MRITSTINEKLAVATRFDLLRNHHQATNVGIKFKAQCAGYEKIT